MTKKRRFTPGMKDLIYEGPSNLFTSSLTPIIDNKFHIIGPESKRDASAFVETCVIRSEDFQIKCEQTNDVVHDVFTLDLRHSNIYDIKTCETYMCNTIYIYIIIYIYI